ncbi:MAG: adenylosuccinate synthase [Candidatus Thermoplasmatota archaeon]
MTVNLVVGTQWGDEGKGKVVDYHSKDADYVVRFHGGNNAGHTIKVGDEIYKLHVTPSGVIQGKTGVIGNGVALDPKILNEEIESLKERGIKPHLLISDRVNIIMPYHKKLDGAEEKLRGDKKIGTTQRGIGPCYSDKIARKGIRAIDLLDRQTLKEKLDRIIPVKQRLYDVYNIDEKIDKKQLLKDYLQQGKKLREYITRTHVELNQAIKEGKNVLFEGAQGTMLDVDFGTYPYTTSSHTVAGGASIGVGVSPSVLDEIIGIVKAYTTRVGEGPLPTELSDENGKHLQEKGHEFGTTTSRPRRCGWLDLVVVNHSCKISGVTQIALTKLDVLNGLDKVKICTAYKLDGKKIDYFPADINQVERCIPVYEEFEGWDEFQSSPQSLEDLPEATQRYISFIEQKLDIPISLVSIGPDREETIQL